MSAKDIANAAIAKFNEKITDEVFQTIESDKELMSSYLRAVSDNGLDVVNQTIGKAVKTAYGLEDKGQCDEPCSNLIKSFTTYQPK